MLLTNARIYTLDDNVPVASSIWIKDGLVVALNPDIDSVISQTKGLQIENLQGNIILPGLTDAHIHLEKFAFNRLKVDCEVPTLALCLERVHNRARELPPKAWVLGHGWNQNDWGGVFPHAADLDQISEGHPVYLTAKSLHAGWANSRALAIAGINRETPDPEGGGIQRDKDGFPTGILFESAMELVSRKIPVPDTYQITEAVDQAQKALWRLGITGVHDFDGQNCLTALRGLYAQGRLQLRVLKSIPVEKLDEAISQGITTGEGDDWLRIGSIKAFADGALGPRTAAMFQPYAGEPTNTGYLLLDQESLVEIGQKAIRGGLSLAVHAIGDRANHEVINAFMQLREFEKFLGIPPKKHRIEHVQCLNPADKHRLGLSGLVASMQPIHAISDRKMADRYWGARSVGAYAWRDQLQAGAVLIFGSDAPVDSPNPFWGIHAALTRRAVGESEGWYPEQCLTLNQALMAYTRLPAQIAGWEKNAGCLVSGSTADLIVLDQDPFKIPVDGIYDLLPTRTMVAGEWVYIAD